MKRAIIASIVAVAAIVVLLFIFLRPTNKNPNLVFIGLSELPGISSEVIQANGKLILVQEPILYDKKTESATFIVSILNRKHFDRSSELVFGGDAESLRLFVNEVTYVNSLPNAVWNGAGQLSKGGYDAVANLITSVIDLVKSPIESVKGIGSAVVGLAGYAKDVATGRANVFEDATQLCNAYWLNVKCIVASEHKLNYLDLKTPEAKGAVEFEAKPRLGGRAATEILMLVVPFAAAKYAGEATEAGAMAERMSAAGRIDANAAKGLKWSKAFTESASAMKQASRLAETTEGVREIHCPALLLGWRKPQNIETLSDAFPKLADDVSDVHHAIPQKILTLRPDLFSDMEIHSLENLRGIPTAMERTLHDPISKEWNSFFRETAANTLTREKLLGEATRIDQTYGHYFQPALF